MEVPPRAGRSHPHPCRRGRGCLPAPAAAAGPALAPSRLSREPRPQAEMEVLLSARFWCGSPPRRQQPRGTAGNHLERDFPEPLWHRCCWHRPMLGRHAALQDSPRPLGFLMLCRAQGARVGELSSIPGQAALPAPARQACPRAAAPGASGNALERSCRGCPSVRRAAPAARPFQRGRGWSCAGAPWPKGCGARARGRRSQSTGTLVCGGRGSTRLSCETLASPVAHPWDGWRRAGGNTY